VFSRMVRDFYRRRSECENDMRGFRYLLFRLYWKTVAFVKSARQKFSQKKINIISRFAQDKRLRTVLVLLVLPVMSILCLMLTVFSNVPSKKELEKIKNPIASEVYTADSVLIGRYFIQDRTQVRYDEISPLVVNALISTEDVRFFEHEGVDFVSLGRVIVKSILLQNESSGGGSTITQQLAKNLYPRKKFWVCSMLVNKLRETVIARRLEHLYTKEEIITLYLNTIPFGDNTYGIQAAAQRFFSVDAKDLTLEQAAVLIGMLKATHYYNPRLFPSKAKSRRNVVIAQMKKYKFIEDHVKDSVQRLPLQLHFREEIASKEVAPYFREYVRQYLEKWCETHTKSDGSNYDLHTDGLKIYTTIDSRLQAYAEQAVSKQMSDLQKQFFDHWGKEKPWKGKENIVTEALHRSARYKALKEQGLSESEMLAVLKKPVQTRVFTWEGPREVTMSPLDSVCHHLQYLNAGFIAMDPTSGAIKAWVGGISHDFFQYDHVKLSTKRQVGSIFKPIVYAAAIEQGIRPCEFIPADQETYIDEEGEAWTPRNSQYDYQLEYSMRGALAYSVNTVSVKLIQRAGIDNTINLARSMGIKSEMPDVPSIALGSSAISLMEMASAYSSFANEGVATSPNFILEIQDREGNVFSNFKSNSKGRVLSKETALKVRQMLQTVVQEGTASRLRWKYGVYNDVAGKTGTTQANADGWFMAMTPNLVIGTWVGADDPRIRFRNTSLGQGSNTALPMVAYFLKNVNEDDRFKEIAIARFRPLPYEVRKCLDCDLYEINENLWTVLEKKVQQRDSLMRADTLATPPVETFLETLYKRKKRILLASQAQEDAQAKNTLLIKNIDR
jgi:penicillin-binding protein 1A